MGLGELAGRLHVVVGLGLRLGIGFGFGFGLGFGLRLGLGLGLESAPPGSRTRRRAPGCLVRVRGRVPMRARLREG